MGVPGLWEVLQPSSSVVSINSLCLDYFDGATVDGTIPPSTSISISSTGISSSLHALRIGIDASLWIFHAHATPGFGSNPFLRTIFFRLLRLLQQPLLPLFVFDGPEKPEFKRGNKVAGTRFGRSDQDCLKMKELLDYMGIEYWDSPGEAEAELAEMNKKGDIDAVLTDDVDVLVFGAKVVLRNPSKTLSGNVASASSRLEEEYQIFKARDIKNHKDVNLEVDDLIFMALCCGGDYHPQGLPNCGIKIAYALARSGLSRELLQGYRSYLSELASLPTDTDTNLTAANAALSRFDSFLHSFRESVKHELSTNESGFLPNKRKALARDVPDSFPDIQILDYYVNPRVSAPDRAWPGFGKRASTGLSANATIRAGCSRDGTGLRGGRGDPRAFARTCERFFEWATKEEVGRRMRTLVWKGEIVEQVRQGLLEKKAMGRESDRAVVLASKSKDQGPATSRLNANTTKTSSGNGQLTNYFPQASTSSSLTTLSISAAAAAAHPRLPHDFPAPKLLSISRRRHAPSSSPGSGGELEYRVEYDPSEWTRVVQDSMEGKIRTPVSKSTPGLAAQGTAYAEGDDSDSRESLSASSDASGSSSAAADTPKKTPRRKEIDLESTDKAWIPERVLKHGYSSLIAEFENKEALKKTPKRKAGTASGSVSGSKSKSKEVPSVQQQAMFQGWLTSGRRTEKHPELNENNNTDEPITISSSAPSSSRRSHIRDVTPTPMSNTSASTSMIDLSSASEDETTNITPLNLHAKKPPIQAQTPTMTRKKLNASSDSSTASLEHSPKFSRTRLTNTSSSHDSGNTNKTPKNDKILSYEETSNKTPLMKTTAGTTKTTAIDLTETDDEETPKRPSTTNGNERSSRGTQEMNASNISKVSHNPTSNGHELLHFESDLLAQEIAKITERIRFPSELFGLDKMIEKPKDAINRFRREIKVRLEELHAVLLQKERAISKIPVKAVDDLLFNLLRLDGEDEWCSKSNVRLVRDCLDLLPSSLTDPSYHRLLQTRIRSIFSSNPHPDLNLETGRKLSRPAGGDKGRSDLHGEQGWKENGFWGVWNVVRGCMERMNNTVINESIPLFLPPMMTMLDDYEAAYRLRGMRCVEVLIDKLPATTMKRMGTDKLFIISLQHSISLHPSPPDPILLPTALDLLLNLLHSTTPSGSLERANAIAEAVQKGIINGWIFIPSGPQGIAGLTAVGDAVEMVCEEVGVGVVRWLKDFIPSLSQPLSLPTTTTNIAHQLSSLRALSAVITATKKSKRIDKWRGKILDGVGRLWSSLIDIEDAEGLDMGGEGFEEDDLGALRSATVNLMKNLVDSVPSMKDNELKELVKMDEDLYSSLVEFCLRM